MTQQTTIPPVEETLARVVQTLPTREYVSSGQLALGRMLQALQRRFHSFKGEPSEKDFRDMMKDPAVAQSIRILKLMVMKSGITFQNPIRDSDPRFQKGEEIRQFVEFAFGKLRSPYLRTLWQILDAFIWGYKVAEITYQIETSGKYRGMMTLKRIAVKPQKATALVVDVTYNVVGLLGLRANGTLPVSNLILADISEVLPREKFLVLTIDPEDEDPRGRSLLYSAWTTWQLKNACLPLVKKYLERQADPALIGVLGEHAREQEIRDENGNVKFNEDGTRQTEQPGEAMARILSELREASAVALPYGSSVTPLTLTGDSDLHEWATEYFDSMIRASILLQTLAVSEGRHQARASSETHANILADLVQVLKDFVAECLYTDIIRPMVRYNFGPDAEMEMSPTVALGDPNKRDFATSATAFGSLGYSVDETQFPAIDAMLGVPVRDPEEVRQARIEELELKAQAMNAMAPQDYAPKKGTPGVPTNAGTPGGTNPDDNEE